ncbi:hypothetical protein GQ43DRAFT_469050 [Delitschia confertaspora ATCC 74209]|uniref:Uncharacterized protein n=1 Tax=Delitschia confertaspora ATCC 74209 TaxID=1513339 RepID=A0A9P4JXT0_9PLEO|nr:hypothetical protein GQ43DRAFT_469050 [Delitschia confertaspora ATCC 74209]
MTAQNIFTSFIEALPSITENLKGVNVVQNIGNDVAEEVVSTIRACAFFSLANSHTDRLVEDFTAITRIEELKRKYNWNALEPAKIHNDVGLYILELQSEARKHKIVSIARIALQQAMEFESAYLVPTEEIMREISR